MSVAMGLRGLLAWQSVLTPLLTVAVFASSFGIVMTRHEVRMEFIHSENLRKGQDALRMRWESLQLEHSALRSEARVETIARNELGMKTPERIETMTLPGKAE